MQLISQDEGFFPSMKPGAGSEAQLFAISKGVSGWHHSFFKDTLCFP